MRLLAFLPALALVASCGSSPAAPAGPFYPAIAGNWSGTLQTGNLGSHYVRFTLTQSNENVTGIWTSDSGWSGTLSGAIQTSGSFSGELRVLTEQGAASCSATATVGGGFSASRFSMASNGFSGNCPALATDVTILTQRE